MLKELANTQLSIEHLKKMGRIRKSCDFGFSGDCSNFKMNGSQWWLQVFCETLNLTKDRFEEITRCGNVFSRTDGEYEKIACAEEELLAQHKRANGGRTRLSRGTADLICCDSVTIKNTQKVMELVIMDDPFVNFDSVRQKICTN